jgi:kinesin family member 1
MQENQTTIKHPENGQVKTFTFDDSIWSCNRGDEHFRSQEYVHDTIGNMLLDSATQGYNACLFAYGQTGSG